MAKVTTWLFIESEDLSVDGMSQMIGVKCDRSWRKGDPRGRTGKHYTTKSWKLESVAEVEESSEVILNQLTASLRDILNRMRGHEQGFHSAASHGISGLMVGIQAESPPAILFDADIIKGISALGVDLELDLVLG